MTILCIFYFNYFREAGRKDKLLGLAKIEKNSALVLYKILDTKFPKKEVDVSKMADVDYRENNLFIGKKDNYSKYVPGFAY